MSPLAAAVWDVYDCEGVCGVAPMSNPPCTGPCDVSDRDAVFGVPPKRPPVVAL